MSESHGSRLLELRVHISTAEKQKHKQNILWTIMMNYSPRYSVVKSESVEIKTQNTTCCRLEAFVERQQTVRGQQLMTIFIVN